MTGGPDDEPDDAEDHRAENDPEQHRDHRAAILVALPPELGVVRRLLLTGKKIIKATHRSPCSISAAHDGLCTGLGPIVPHPGSQRRMDATI